LRNASEGVVSDTTISAEAVRPLHDLLNWRMAGHGSFAVVADGVVESVGGPGLWWLAGQEFGDFVLDVDWRIHDLYDNSGVFIRFPPLGATDPDSDWRLAVAQGLEIQIDDRGYDPAAKSTCSMLHMTGAIYRLAPAARFASRNVGAWNHFRVTARGIDISVALNDTMVARLDHDVGRPLRGHVGLQAHHAGSRVQFRSLSIRPLA
jgi:hypothetical protein